LDESVERLGAAAVAVQVVQHLVEEQQHGRIGSLEYACDRLRSGRRGLCRRTECLNALIPRKLSRDVDPWRLATRLRIPRVADEHGHLRLRYGRNARISHEIRHAAQTGDRL